MAENVTLNPTRRRIEQAYSRRRQRTEWRDELWTSIVSLATVGIFLAGSVAANVVLYVTEGTKLDLVVGGVALLAVLAALLPPPQKVRNVVLGLAVFWIVLGLATRHEWAGTPRWDVVRACIPVVLSGACFIAGAALRQRARPFVLWLLLGLAGACFAGVVLMTVGVLHTAKNVMGGTMFELAMFMVGCVYVVTGKFSWRWGLGAGALIVAGAVLTDHRMMMALGAAIGLGIVAFSIYRPAWLRAVPPVLGVLAGIGTILFFTTFAYSDIAKAADARMQAESGRTAMSGRQKLFGEVVHAIATGPKVGYGPTMNAERVTGLQWSAHNGFLQTGLQTGLVGIAVTLAIFALIAVRAVTAQNGDAGAMLSLLLTGVIIHNSSENVLFTNNFPIAAMAWLNLGFYYAGTYLPPLKVKRRKRSS